MILQNIRQRLFSDVWLKAVGCTLAISGFFVAYFYLMHHPVLPVRTMPVFALDRATPVVGWTVWVYFSLWVYICLPTALMGTRGALRVYSEGAFVLAVLGLGVFFVYPTAVPVWPIDWAEQYPMLAFLKSADSAGNACPSLHVAYSVFAGGWMAVLFKRIGLSMLWQWANALWALAIVISTMTTKQHVLIDVFYGCLAGGAVFGLNYWWARRREVVL